MAKYSPVGPIAVLEQLHKYNVLGDYLLLIAPDVIAHPNRYKALVDSLRQTVDDLFIIMDNGVIENGTPLDIQSTLLACDVVKANVVVLPDTLRSREATCKAAVEAAQVVQDHYDIMAVPQGRTTAEVLSCVEQLRDSIDPKYWGIPRWMANDFGSRHYAVDAVMHCTRNPHVHLLGMSQRHADDLECSHRIGVSGIDSANPLVMGMHNIKQAGNFVHLDRNFGGKNYWDCTDVNEIMVQNVKTIRKYVQ